MPLSLDEYGIGKRYTVARISLDETGGGEGVELVTQRPFQDVPLFNGRYNKGEYSRKIHRVESKLSWFLRRLAPKEWFTVLEESWNAYPYLKTIITNESIADSKIIIESMHLADRGTAENALDLPAEILQQREVIFIDIAGECVCPKDYKAEFDPKLFTSKKAQRGPLSGQWRDTADPVMCVYKVVTVDFNKWSLIRHRVETYFQKEYRRTFQRVHRQMFVWLDQWYGMSPADVRAYEEEIIKALDKERKSDVKRGTPPPDDD